MDPTAESPPKRPPLFWLVLRFAMLKASQARSAATGGIRSALSRLEPQSARSGLKLILSTRPPPAILLAAIVFALLNCMPGVNFAGLAHLMGPDHWMRAAWTFRALPATHENGILLASLSPRGDSTWQGQKERFAAARSRSGPLLIDLDTLARIEKNSAMAADDGILLDSSTPRPAPSPALRDAALSALVSELAAGASDAAALSKARAILGSAPDTRGLRFKQLSKKLGPPAPCQGWELAKTLFVVGPPPGPGCSVDAQWSHSFFLGLLLCFTEVIFLALIWLLATNFLLSLRTWADANTAALVSGWERDGMRIGLRRPRATKSRPSRL